MFLNFVPHFSSPEDVPAIRIEIRRCSWFVEWLVYWVKVIEPIPDFRTIQQMLSVRNGAMPVAGWEANIAHNGRAHAMEMIDRSVAKEITSQQVLAFIKPGEFFD